jgi:hemerythrin
MLEWTSEMSVEIAEFDTHHKRIVDLINKLGASLNTDEARKVTEEALAELSNYCFYHFFAEEDAMERYSDPGYSGHREEHLQFIEKIFQFVSDFHSSKENISQDLLDFLWNWLKNHILKTDKTYTAALHAGGMS